MADSSVNNELPENERLSVLYEEIRRLPDEYRLAVVYCYLEEMTHAQAARELGWTEGMVRGRVAKARSVLRRNLARRGLVLSAAALAATLSGPSASAVLAALALGWMDTPR